MEVISEQVGKKKVLVIVDVQFEFCNHFDVNYLNELQHFLDEHRQEYDLVIAVYTDPDSTSFEDGRRTAKFIAEQADRFIEKWFYVVDDDWLNETECTPIQGTLHFTDAHGNIILWVENSQHQDYFVSPWELTQLAQQTNQVDLAGGARDHCLAEVQAVFDYFQVPTRVLDPLTYSLNWQESFVDDDGKRFEEYPWVDIPKSKDIRM